MRTYPDFPEVVEAAPSMESTFGGVRAYAIDPQRAAALVRLCERLTSTPLATR